MQGIEWVHAVSNQAGDYEQHVDVNQVEEKGHGDHSGGPGDGGDGERDDQTHGQVQGVAGDDGQLLNEQSSIDDNPSETICIVKVKYIFNQKVLLQES